MNSISPNLNLMIRACEKASKIIIRDFGELENLQVSKKGPRDFVTKTDIRVEKILIEELSKSKKNFSFLTEESGKLLNENIKDLHIIAKGLLEYETLTGEEIKNLIKGIKPKRDDDFSSDSSDDSSDNKKEPSNKGPLPSFTKDQNFPLPN